MGISNRLTALAFKPNVKLLEAAENLVGIFDHRDGKSSEEIADLLFDFVILLPRSKREQFIEILEFEDSAPSWATTFEKREFDRLKKEKLERKWDEFFKDLSWEL